MSAGTYVKLQQAYISEAVAVGDWSIIGYKGPGEQKSTLESSTTNFTYKDGGTGYSNHTTALSSTAVTGFTVQNNLKLNDCTSAAGNWTVTVASAGATASEGEATFTASVATACTDLTPNFNKIGK